MITKKFKIKNWMDWQLILELAAEEFLFAKLTYPDGIIASKHTFSQFDFQLNIVPGARDSVLEEGENGSPQAATADYIHINGFDGGDYFLDFYIDDEIKNKTFVLVNTGGENEEEQEKVPQITAAVCA